MGQPGAVANGGASQHTDEISLRQLVLRMLYSPGQLVRVVWPVVSHIFADKMGGYAGVGCDWGDRSSLVVLLSVSGLGVGSGRSRSRQGSRWYLKEAPSLPA